MKHLKLILLFVFIITQLCSAQWTQTSGPFGANVYSLLYKDSIIIAGSVNGIYRTTLGTMVWQSNDENLTGCWIFELADLEDNIYAATNHGIYFSSDTGLTWNLSGLSNYIVTKLAVKDSLLFAGTVNGLFISSDRGSTWNEIDSEFISKNVCALATNSNLVLVSTFDDGLYKSSDNGETWVKLNSNTYFALIFSGNIILAASWGNEVYRSTDFGNTWMSHEIGENWVGVTNFKEDGQNIFAATNYGVFLSTNTGITWQSRGLTGIFVHNLIIDNPYILAGTHQGIYLSFDYGLTWMLENDGLLSSEVTSLAFSNSILYAGTYGYGVFLSTDDGESWSSFNNGLTHMYVSGVGVTEDYLLAGTNGGIYRTSSFIDQWQKVANNFDSRNFVFTGNEVIASSDEGVLRSTDDGNTWTLIDNIGGYQCWSVLKNDQTIIAGYNQKGIRISTDNGLNWHYSNTGLPNYSTINTLELSDNRILAGTSGTGVYLSDDYGQSWYQSELDTTQIWTLYNYRQYIFGCGGRGICQSNDNGMNWFWINRGLINYFVKALAADGEYLFSGIADAAVWRRPLSELSEVMDIKQNPSSFSLSQNYPNPFNPSTMISYSIPRNSFVHLKVFDILGNEVAELVKEQKPAGSYEVKFDAALLPSGVYFYQLTAGEFIQTKKMILLK